MKNVILLIFLFLTIIFNKKNISNKKPNHIRPEVYCNSCQAIIRETLNILKESKKEQDVIASLD